MSPEIPCKTKSSFGSRLEAESALATARSQWRRNPSRAEQPPVRVYRCDFCDRWHMTHQLEWSDRGGKI